MNIIKICGQNTSLIVSNCSLRWTDGLCRGHFTTFCLILVSGFFFTILMEISFFWICFYWQELCQWQSLLISCHDWGNHVITFIVSLVINPSSMTPSSLFMLLIFNSKAPYFSHILNKTFVVHANLVLQVIVFIGYLFEPIEVNSDNFGQSVSIKWCCLSCCLFIL